MKNSFHGLIWNCEITHSSQFDFHHWKFTTTSKNIMTTIVSVVFVGLCSMHVPDTAILQFHLNSTPCKVNRTCAFYRSRQFLHCKGKEENNKLSCKWGMSYSCHVSLHEMFRCVRQAMEKNLISPSQTASSLKMHLKYHLACSILFLCFSHKWIKCQWLRATWLHRCSVLVFTVFDITLPQC